MIILTAEIADGLLAVKDSDCKEIPESVKRDIIRLADLSLLDNEATEPTFQPAEPEESLPVESAESVEIETGDSESDEENLGEIVEEDTTTVVYVPGVEAAPSDAVDEYIAEVSDTEEVAETEKETEEETEEAEGISVLEEETVSSEDECVGESTENIDSDPAPAQEQEPELQQDNEEGTDEVINEPCEANETLVETDAPSNCEEPIECADSQIETSAQQSRLDAQQESGEQLDTEAKPDGDELVFFRDPDELQKAFSLNDVFLFRRELFGGSKEVFENAILAAALARDMEEYRDFLSSSLGLNLKRRDVKDFIATLEPYF